MSTYRCSKCNKVLAEIGIPPQIQIVQMYKQVVNIGSTEVPEEIKNDPYLYRGFFCPNCNKAFCPQCSHMQGEICPECGQRSLMPAYRPLLKKIAQVPAKPESTLPTTKPLEEKMKLPSASTPNAPEALRQGQIRGLIIMSLLTVFLLAFMTWGMIDGFVPLWVAIAVSLLTVGMTVAVGVVVARGPRRH